MLNDIAAKTEPNRRQGDHSEVHAGPGFSGLMQGNNLIFFTSVDMRALSNISLYLGIQFVFKRVVFATYTACKDL